jgi:hypothetical protein
MTTKLDNKLLKELILEAIEEIRDGYGSGSGSRPGFAQKAFKTAGVDPLKDKAAFPAMSKMQKLRKDLQQASLKGAENMTPEEIEELEKSLDDMLASLYGTARKRTEKGLEFENKEETLEEKIARLTREELEAVLDEKKKKKPCKPSKGKRFAKRVNGKCRSYGQAGKAKGGGDRIRPGTKKGDAYCARSAKIKKCKNPPCANDLSRKKWKCRGSKSMKE